MKYTHKNDRTPPDVVCELAELAYKYNASRGDTDEYVSVSVGVMLTLMILPPDCESSLLYTSVTLDDYAQIEKMLKTLKNWLSQRETMTKNEIIEVAFGGEK